MIPATQLSTLTQTQLESWVARAQTHTSQGTLPTYIPRLAEADPDVIAVQIQTDEGMVWTAGEISQRFTLMSVIKPFVLLFLLEQLGETVVLQQVGTKPSDHPFHSLVQLQADQGWPRNPMINSGAIALVSLLPGIDATSRCDRLRQWLNRQAGCNLQVDGAMLASVASMENLQNQALANYLQLSERIPSAEEALEAYNWVCCLAGTVADLAQLGLLLAGAAGNILPRSRRAVNALMLSCGLYQTSDVFAMQVGLPTKSGVSGSLLSIVPGAGAIACYSPALNPEGHSLAGLWLVEQLSQALNLGIFG
ncbi:glutaminase [Neosynechococcus sphagnicola sy1]|uniref:Glutaminase n=1 Tax=Neosynechococcus sphagnicola sy1 TaxID=1497020 RepID=A0A098TMM9_9CYAN|nr:glutaminase [Neosynechococcus sphagnicola]KGF73117.1 glutaminase [Neosynechococcus sphagnicola sy1]